MKIDSLKTLDDCHTMLDSWCGGLHIWFLIRQPVMQEIINQTYSLPNAHLGWRKFSISKALKFLWLSLRKSHYKTEAANIIFFSSGIVNVKRNGKYFNRLYDYFHLDNSFSSVIIEDSYRYEFFTPRSVRVTYSDLIRLKSKLYGGLFSISKDCRVEVSRQMTAIRRAIDFSFSDEFWDNLQKMVFDRLARFEFEKKEYCKLFERVQPKVLFREDASYGQYQTLATACRENNIIFAEMQHGAVSRNHPAYNLGDSFKCNPKIKSLLPDYFLTFGKFWADQINIAGKIVVIGYPFLNSISLEMGISDRVPAQERSILLVSDGNLPGLYRNLAFTLASYASKLRLKVILKLHPGELPSLKERYGDLLKIPEVKIETEESIYCLLARASFVVGCFSTVLYEALAFGHRPYVFLNEISSRCMDLNLFNVFDSVENLVLSLKSKSMQNFAKNNQLSYVWNPEPVKTFRDFVFEVIRGK